MLICSILGAEGLVAGIALNAWRPVTIIIHMLPAVFLVEKGLIAGLTFVVAIHRWQQGCEVEKVARSRFM
jgi:hypothetical protein